MDGFKVIFEVALGTIGFIVISIWLFSPKTVRAQKINLIRSPYPRIDLSSLSAVIVSISKLIAEVIERWILLKRTPLGYWNGVNANLKLLNSTLISSAVLILLHNCKLHGGSASEIYWQKIAIFGAVFATHYFAERASYYEKWSYLANLYNEILKAKPFVSGRETLVADVHSYRHSMNVALVYDIVSMEMWSHSSFYMIFEDVMIEAIKFDRRYRRFTKSQCITFACKLNKEETLDFLRTLQEFHLKKESGSYKDRVYLAVA